MVTAVKGLNEACPGLFQDKQGPLGGVVGSKICWDRKVSCCFFLPQGDMLLGKYRVIDPWEAMWELVGFAFHIDQSQTPGKNRLVKVKGRSYQNPRPLGIQLIWDPNWLSRVNDFRYQVMHM